MKTWAEAELELAGYPSENTEEGPSKWLREGDRQMKNPPDKIFAQANKMCQLIAVWKIFTNRRV
jgi:hypothetical protein